MACTKMTFAAILFVLCATFSVNSAQKRVIELNEDNWTQILQGEWMVEFFAPWCPACKALEQKWTEFATWAPDLSIKVGAVDVTTSPGLSGRFMVTALPTIFHVRNGEFRQYKGSRDKDSFISFIEEKKWEQVEPVSSWKSPDSFQMSVVSSFFKLSQMLRQIHNKLTEDYGLAPMFSYLIFAVGTIVLGALLGLILVCAIDWIYPPKQFSDRKSTSKNNKEKDSDEELLDDEDIKDDLVDDASQSGGDHNNSQSESENLKSSPKVEKVKKRKVKRDD